MRRGHVIVLIAVTSGLLSVLLAVAVNVATGGTLPGAMAAVSWLAWPAVGLLAVVAVGLAIWQQRLAELAGLPPGAGPAPRRPAELPAAPTAFAGRADDLAAVDRLLAGGHRIVALVGPPGAGKSSLALRIAHDRSHGYPDGQLFAALRGAGTDPVAPEAVLTRFLGALGVPDDQRRGGVDDLAARFRSAIADRRVLVVLDDARDAGQVAPLLPGGPGCLVLVTSRRMLAMLPEASPHLVGGLDTVDGCALLADVAGEARTAADPDGTRHIVELCGGLPLAVHIAGARLRARPAWTPTDVAERLADERRRLDELHVGDLAVRSSFEASYVELSTTDRLVFRRAGSHPGQTFSLDAAAALAGLDEPTVAAALDRMIDAHLVESPAPNRYRLHDLLRLFATERLAAEEPPGERDACLERLLDWLTTHARAGDWLARERDNVVAAVRRAIEAGAYERAWALVSTMSPLLTNTGDHPDQLALWRDAAAAATALGDDQGRTRAQRMVSTFYRIAGEVSRALEPAVDALTVAERLGDRRAQAEALVIYGDALRNLFRYDEAEEVLRRALRLFADLDDIHHEINVRTSLGSLYNQSWRPELGIPVLERAMALLPAGHEHRYPWTPLELSAAYKLIGRREEAIALNARGLEICRRSNDEYAQGWALQERGWLAHDGGRHDDATRDMRQALAVFERIRHGTGIGFAHLAIGQVAAAAGRRDEALAAFDTARAQFERLRDRVRAGQSRLHRAVVLAEIGRTAEAAAEWATAEDLIADAALVDAPRLRERLRQHLSEDHQPPRPPAGS